jgi:hypothetical protein
VVLPGERVRWSHPSGSITYNWLRPVRSLVNRIFDPSGDHAAATSSPLVRVSLRTCEPSARITYTSAPSEPNRVNRIRFPSGDHAAGCSFSVVDSSRCRPLPSAFITNRSPSLFGVVAEATSCFPSGDHRAQVPRPIARAPVPSGRMVHMREWRQSGPAGIRSKLSSRPSGDHWASSSHW